MVSPYIMLLSGAATFFTTAAGISIETKCFTTRDGTRYVYDYFPAQGHNATVALIHGYPATRHDWKRQADALISAGYGLIAPDCLGYGDSDMPTEIEAYRLKRLAGHFDEMFHKEDLDAVVGVGHDWGTVLLSQMAVWYPARFERLAFLSVGFSAPGLFFDIDALNAFSLKNQGFMQLGYWYFLNSYNAANLVASHLESFHSLAFPVDNSKWGQNLADLGAARLWLTKNTTTPLPKWLTEEQRETWMKYFRKKGAIVASMNYYKSLLRGISSEDENLLTDKQRTLHVPVLTIAGTQDMVTGADQIRLQTKPWAANGYTERKVDAGHWLMHEKPDDLNSILLEFLES